MKHSFKKLWGSAGVTALLFVLGAGSVRAQAFPEFTVKKGSVTANDEPRSGAVLCAGNDCFEMPTETLNGMKYEFGLEPKGTRIPFGSGSVVLFSAGFNAGGPGWLDRLALLRDDGGGLVNLLPFVPVSRQGEFATCTVDGVSEMPVVVTANPAWKMDAGETRWDDHVYEVTAFRYDKASDKYVQAMRYVTGKKYASGDATPVQVLGPERDEIVRRLRVGTK